MAYDIDRIVAKVAETVKEQEAQRVPSPKALTFEGKMTLALARLLIEGVQKEAQRMGVRSVVAVADGGGNPVSIDCSDGAFYASYDIALNKAYTSVALQMPTVKLATLAAPGGSLYGIQHTNGGRIVIFGGGDPLKYNGTVIGGIGVSGGSAEEDTALSAYGAELFYELTR
ncbi:MAG: heme-binding protein [Clostridia bacterium]|nr:heme-binding protein [Clostridia bacterium]